MFPVSGVRAANALAYAALVSAAANGRLPRDICQRANVGYTPFLDDRLKKLNNKIKSLKKAIEDSATRQEKASRPEMLLSAKDLQIQEYDDALTARIIEKITVRSRNEIEIRLIGGYEKAMLLL